MNSKKIKKLRKKVRPLQVEWLKSILPEDQSKHITKYNVEELLPDDSHVYGGGQIYLTYMSDKWIMKKLKRNPDITNFNELQKLQEEENAQRIFNGY
tara:strand:- start:5290 stop:5580 length:291 start_codon:yes stop_codon:yes gene_type:complete